jgi:ribosome-binding protein aMBF1 (putative translation factor)
LTPESSSNRSYQIIRSSDIEFFDKFDPEAFMRAAAKWVQPEQYEIVGAALAAARRKANLTQVELATRLGKPQSVVSQIEAGQRRVDLIEFLLIVRALGADPVEIFGEVVRSLPK